MSKRRPRTPPQQPRKHSVRRELLKLRREIDADLAAGRISQFDYDFCRGRIEKQLEHLAQPVPPGEIQVIGIPKKQIDWDHVARLFVLTAEDKLRRDAGKPPLDPEEHRQREVGLAIAMREAKQRKDDEKERKRQDRRRHFVKRKPAQLRQETWDWVISKQVDSLPDASRLGSLMHQLGIIDQPHLLRETVIQLDDGQDYVIDLNAAHDLARHRENVRLVRLVDQSKRSTPRKGVVDAISKGTLFEQID